MGPRYPSYPTQPFTGDPPSMWSPYNKASDLTYSGSTAPHFRSNVDRMHGRYLAGLGAEVQDEETEAATGSQPGWSAINELAVLAEMDDVQQDGIFDPPGTRPNINPDAGILAARFDLPGYLARERMFAKSEVVDVTTGRPEVFVNAGAVSMDSAAQVAFIENGMFEPPAPVLGASRTRRMPDQSIVNVVQNPQAIPFDGFGYFGADAVPTQSTSAPMPAWKLLALTGAVGLGIGAVYQVVKKGKRMRSNRRGKR